MEELCRDRYFEVPVALYRLLTCSMCYNYLFYSGGVLQPHPNQPWTLVSVPGNTLYSSNFTVIADVSNETSVNHICFSLSKMDCNRWRECCYAASRCCERQLSTPKRNDSESKFCPRTWDGFGCFDDTQSDTRTFVDCPNYVEHASLSGTFLC